MIEITKPSGEKVWLANAAIASVETAGTSSQWHGIRSYVKTFDGKWLEARETCEEIVKQLEERGNED